MRERSQKTKSKSKKRKSKTNVDHHRAWNQHVLHTRDYTPKLGSKSPTRLCTQSVKDLPWNVPKQKVSSKANPPTHHESQDTFVTFQQQPESVPKPDRDIVLGHVQTFFTTQLSLADSLCFTQLTKFADLMDLQMLEFVFDAFIVEVMKLMKVTPTDFLRNDEIYFTDETLRQLTSRSSIESSRYVHSSKQESIQLSTA